MSELLSYVKKERSGTNPQFVHHNVTDDGARLVSEPSKRGDAIYVQQGKQIDIKHPKPPANQMQTPSGAGVLTWQPKRFPLYGAMYGAVFGFRLRNEKGFPPFGWKPLVLLVGAAGFELATPCTPCKCATRLRYAPTRGAEYNRKRLSTQTRSISMTRISSPRRTSGESAGLATASPGALSSRRLRAPLMVNP